MSENPGTLLPGISVNLSAKLRRNGREKHIASRKRKWSIDSEWAPTEWYHAKSGAVNLTLARRNVGDNRTELQAIAAARQGWSLSELAFDVRVRSARHHEVSWPFGPGAIVGVAELLKAGRTLELTYPVYASMQWVDVFGGGKGIYVASHDDQPWFKHMRLHAEKSTGGTDVIISFIYTDLEWPADKTWPSPPLVVQRHDGDWRQGASLYRQWAESWFRHDPVPEFLRRSGGHNMISFPAGGGRLKYSQFAERSAEARKLDLDGIHVADWMQPGFDTHYPAYQPDPTLGGRRGLKRAIDDMAAAGSWTCLYLNGRLLDPDGPHGRHAFEWAAKLPPHVQKRFSEMWKRTQDFDRPGWQPQQAVPGEPAPFNIDGTAAQEWWGRVLAPMCPSVPAWRELWLARMTEVLETLRPKIFQVDQVCGCWGMPCYDESHPHRSPALAWSAYKTFTREMRRRAQAIDPDIAFWSEGVNDILGQAFDGLQAQLGFESLLAGLGRWEPRLFKITFPEYVLVTGDLSDERHLRPLAWAIITGGHYHFFLPDSDKLSRRMRQWIRFAVKVRSRCWREFTSSDVQAPEGDGDDGVSVLAYRGKKRCLLVGAPLGPDDDPGRAYEVTVRIEEPGFKVIRAESMGGASKTHAKMVKGGCRITGSGPFAVLIG